MLNNIRIGTFDSRYFAEVNECRFSIQKTFAGFRLSFNFTVVPFEKEIPNPVFLERMEIDLFYKEENSSRLLGRMIDDFNDNSRQLVGREFSLRKYFDIRADDFLRLMNESHRGDMQFELQAYPVFQNTTKQAKNETGSLKIPHSEWLQYLNRAELDRFELITIRIPVSGSHLHAPFSEALKKIRQAEQQYLRGDWNGAASSCRAAWRTILSTAPQGTKPFEHLLTRITGDPKRKQFGMALIKGLNDIENAAVHLEGDVKNGVPPADITAEEALLCIHWYSAMIGYLSAL